MDKRNKLSLEVLKSKKKFNLKNVDLVREGEIVQNVNKIPKKHEVDDVIAGKIIKDLIKEGKRFRSKKT